MQLSSSGQADHVFTELLKSITICFRDEGNVATADLNADIYWIINFQNASFTILLTSRISNFI
jgi:hypothetical protein